MLPWSNEIWNDGNGQREILEEIKRQAQSMPDEVSDQLIFTAILAGLAQNNRIRNRVMRLEYLAIVFFLYGGVLSAIVGALHGVPWLAWLISVLPG